MENLRNKVSNYDWSFWQAAALEKMVATDKKNFEQLKREFDDKKYELKKAMEDVKVLNKAKSDSEALIYLQKEEIATKENQLV